MAMERHYGLDWLRIGAFVLLILYHVGMVFVPWAYHVKLPGPDWAAVPMLATNPWRLSLLFVVSGYASRALLVRAPALGAFARSRSARLLVPLAFGMAVVVPPQAWAELASKYGYGAGYLTFWARDYFTFSSLHGVVLPSWNHLWFVAYLWAYTMLLSALLAVLPARVKAALQRGFNRLFAGPALLVLPLGWLLAVNMWLFPGGTETHALFDDSLAHASYLPAFLFGFGLAAAPGVLATFVRWWAPMAVVAVLSYAVAAFIAWRWAGVTYPPFPVGHLYSGTRAVQGWSSIAALIGFADRHWNHDHRWRPMLTEAVFPFYLIHQTIIVVVAWLITPARLGAGANFAILVVATVAGCWAFYLIGRSIAPLRPLIGLRARGRSRPLSPVPVA
jgi:peptidoglycan/LPS O-acetylase OafA/YrhL